MELHLVKFSPWSTVVEALVSGASVGEALVCEAQPFCWPQSVELQLEKLQSAELHFVELQLAKPSWQRLILQSFSW